MNVAQQIRKMLSSSSLKNGDVSRQQEGTKQGSPSMRKLPPLPTQDEELSMRHTVKQRSPTNVEHLAAYGPFFQEYSMLAEYNHLRKQRLPGVYVIPSRQSALVWNGVIFIRLGIYQDGVFRFKMKIPANYPDGDCPSLVFTPPIFHPIVNPLSGEVNVKRAFQSWRPNVNHLWQVLLYARRIFYKVETNNPWNKEAAELLEKDEEAFKERVAENIKEINESLFESVGSRDEHFIRFTEWDDQRHAEVLRRMFGERKSSFVDRADLNLEDGTKMADQDILWGPKPKLNGLSYIEPGSTTIFSKEDDRG